MTQKKKATICLIHPNQPVSATTTHNTLWNMQASLIKPLCDVTAGCHNDPGGATFHFTPTLKSNHLSATDQLLWNYWITQFTKSLCLANYRGHHAPSSSWCILDCMSEEFGQTAGRCVCACVCVCSMYSTKQISAHKHQCHFFWIGLLTRQMQRQQTFQHTVCVQSVISSGFSYENIIALGFSYQKHSAWRFVRQRTLGIKQLTLCRSTHRRVWRRSCWRTPGCQHCNWGGRVSPSHSGWCYTAGQRTWRRCAPAPWSAWTVHLQERRCHTEQFSDQLTRATHQGEDLFSGWGGQCPTITHHRTHDRIRSF